MEGGSAVIGGRDMAGSGAAVGVPARVVAASGEMCRSAGVPDGCMTAARVTAAMRLGQRGQRACEYRPQHTGREKNALAPGNHESLLNLRDSKREQIDLTNTRP
jgi:hypothetical protein